MIRNIDNDEFDDMGGHGRGRSSATYNAILKMKPAEIIGIPKAGWKSKHTPPRMVALIEKKYKRIYDRKVSADRSEWMIKRVS